MDRVLRWSIIVLTLALLGVGGYLGWVFFFPFPTSAPHNDLPSAATSTLATPRLVAVSREPLFDYAPLSADDTLHITRDGRIRRETRRGEETLSNAPIVNMVSVSLSPDKQKLLVAFGAPHNLQFSIFYIAKRRWQPLPERGYAASWSPKGDALVHLSLKEAGGETLLRIFDTTQPSPKQRFSHSLFLLDLIPLWGEEEDILLATRPQEKTYGVLLRFNLKKKTLQKVAEGMDLHVAQAGDTSLLISSEEEGGRTTILAGIDGARITDVPLVPAPEQCTLKEPLLYCAIHARSTFSALTPSRAEDAIYAVNLKDRSIKEVVPQGALPLNVARITFQGGTVLILNQYDHLLYILH